MRIAGILGLLLLSFVLAGLKQSSREPVTVTFLDVEYDTPDLLPEFTQDLQAFTKETGIQIKRLPGPEGSLNDLVLWRQLLEKGASTPDVYSIDVIWPVLLNQYLVDLKPYFANELSAQNPVVLASYTVGDKLVAMPHHAYVGVLLYRTDLLRKYGYRGPPKTWDELGTMASRIQAGERAQGPKDFWGYVWQGAVSEDLTCAGLEWQISEGAGRIIEDNKTISVNNPVTVRVWQRAARWVGSISPPGVVAYSKWDAKNAFYSGKAAFLRDWEGDSSITNWSPLRGLSNSDIGVTGIPGGRSGQGSTLGGNGLAISKTSAHTRESLDMIRFLIQRDVQHTRAREHSLPPAGLELYDLPAVLQPYPQIARKQHATGVLARPSIAAGQHYEDVSRAYIKTLHAVLTGEMIPSAAAAALEKELMEITGFRPGPPSKGN